VKSRTNRPFALDRMSRFRWSIAGAREKGICSSSELRERMSIMRRRPEPPALSTTNSGLKVAPRSRGRLLRITPARSMRSSCRVTHGLSSWEGLILWKEDVVFTEGSGGGGEEGKSVPLLHNEEGPG
jgi:hypothetical protein